MNPEAGVNRSDEFVGLQEAFVDKHVRDVSERFDFDSVRIGIQPFSTDFRGFLFQDNQLGARLFGTRDNNLVQYNLAYFRCIEKDTNSGLNDVTTSRCATTMSSCSIIYRQDMPSSGFTSQVIVALQPRPRGGRDALRHERLHRAYPRRSASSIGARLRRRSISATTAMGTSVDSI